MCGKVSYLTFECSTLCNMDCNFCFSDWRTKSNATDTLDTIKAKAIIQKLKSNGLEAINFTGGEPLLRKDITELISYAKSCNLKVILSTNGLLLEKFLPNISKYVDFIGLPLDSSNSKVHNSMRPITTANLDHHALVLKLIDIINRDYNNIGIKINTVVSKQNKDTILGIGELLNDKVVSWKLSQFIPASYGEKHTSFFEITDNTYIKLSNECKNKYPELNIIATVAYSRDKGCRVLTSNGHLHKPVRNKLIDLGEIILEDNNSVKPQYPDDFDNNLNIKFLAITYPDRNNQSDKMVFYNDK